MGKMKLDLIAFHEYLKINKHNLDEEIVRQAELFGEIGDAYVDAAAQRDAAKEALACVDAELDGDIRSNAGDIKITETMVKNEVILHPKHIKAFDAWLDAKLIADKFGVVKEAFAQRQYMLRELAGLYQSNYYQDKAIKGDARTDAVVYKRHRERIGEARAKRDQE